MQAVFSPMMRDLCRFAGQVSELRSGDAGRVSTRAIQGLVLAAGIAASAKRLQALSVTGAVAATVVGAAVHTGIGAHGSVAMVSYFAGASALGRLPKQTQPVQRRGARRDAVQVLANGGPAAVFAILHARSPGTLGELAVTAFYGSLAAAAADTAATEIGTRWGGQPRSIVSGRRTMSGQSGSVTLAGLAASVVVSLAMAAAAHPGAANRRVRAISCAAGGFAGSLTDSLLGALIQEQRWCESCCVSTELPVHTCGDHTQHHSGMPAVNNDVVNLISGLAGGLAAIAVSAALPKLTQCNGSRVEFVTTLTSSRLPRDFGAP